MKIRNKIEAGFKQSERFYGEEFYTTENMNTARQAKKDGYKVEKEELKNTTIYTITR